MRVPYFRPDIGADEEDAVTRVLRSGWLTTGAVATEFEEAFRQTVGARYAVAVNSCTSGLHAALLAAGVKAGDEVITTPLTFCSTVRAIEMTGATPMLVDIGPDLNVDINRIEQAGGERTKAILPVHIAGLPCDMNAIYRLAEAHSWKIVEDAAHAFGAEYRGTPVGSGQASMAVFSFYANKNLTSGEGGMITLNDEPAVAQLRRLTYLGIERGGRDGESRWEYDVVDRGFKYNLSDLLAAIGLAQIKRAEQRARSREAIARYYTERFAGSAELELPTTPMDCRHAWHLYIVRLRLDRLTITRDEFIAKLAERGIGCSVHFKPIPMHKGFSHYGSMVRWPVAKREYPRLVSLPIYPGLSETEQAYVADQILNLLASCRKRLHAVTPA